MVNGPEPEPCATVSQVLARLFGSTDADQFPPPFNTFTIADAEGEESVTESVTFCGDTANAAPGDPVTSLPVATASKVPPNSPSEIAAVKMYVCTAGADTPVRHRVPCRIP